MSQGGNLNPESVATFTGISTQNVKKISTEAFPVIIKTLDALHLSTALVFHEARQEESLTAMDFISAFSLIVQFKRTMLRMYRQIYSIFCWLMLYFKCFLCIYA